jgi:hypothetical protein
MFFSSTHGSNAVSLVTNDYESFFRLVAIYWAASGVPESIQAKKVFVTYEIRILRFAREMSLRRIRDCLSAGVEMSTALRP